MAWQGDQLQVTKTATNTDATETSFQMPSVDGVL